MPVYDWVIAVQEENKEARLVPSVNVLLKKGAKATSTIRVRVDTGADYSIMPFQYIYDLGLEISEGRQIRVKTYHSLDACIFFMKYGTNLRAQDIAKKVPGLDTRGPAEFECLIYDNISIAIQGAREVNNTILIMPVGFVETTEEFGLLGLAGLQRTLRFDMAEMVIEIE